MAGAARAARCDLGHVVRADQDRQPRLHARPGLVRAHAVRAARAASGAARAGRAPAARPAHLGPSLRRRVPRQQRAVHALRIRRATRRLGARGDLERHDAALRARRRAPDAAGGVPDPRARHSGSRSASRACSSCSGRGAGSPAASSWAVQRASLPRSSTASASRTSGATSRPEGSGPRARVRPARDGHAAARGRPPVRGRRARGVLARAAGGGGGARRRGHGGRVPPELLDHPRRRCDREPPR